MTAVAFNPKTLAPAWNAFQSALPVRLAAIHIQAEYDRAVEFMNQLLDAVGDDEEHELAGMFDCWGHWSKTTEARITRCPMPSLAKCWISHGSA